MAFTGTNAVIITHGRLFRDDGTSVLYALNGDAPITMDSGAFVAAVQPQVETAINVNLAPIAKNTNLIPGLL